MAATSLRKIFMISLFLFFIAINNCQAETRVLFIGNSQTHFNGGIDRQLEGLAPSVKTARIVGPSYTLENHWNEGKAIQAIRNGRWDYVVLQEQSQRPVADRKKFYEFARKFDEEIRQSGARTILLMTWARPANVKSGVTTAKLEAAFDAVGNKLSVEVAPAGSAFSRSHRERPDLALIMSDGHPTKEGTYLAACVLYGKILKRSPLGNSYSDRSISPETRRYLQIIAEDTLYK